MLPVRKRSKGMGARNSVIVAAALALTGCGEKQEPEPASTPPLESIVAVERTAQRTLAAGSSTTWLHITGHPKNGFTRYRLSETIDPDAGRYLTEATEGRPSQSAITGPLFSFGADDLGRAYVGPFGMGRRSCWVEAHAPAGELRGTVSAEEALITAHTVLALLTRTVVSANELPVAQLAPSGLVDREDLAGGYEVSIDPPDLEETSDLAVPANLSVTRRYVEVRRRTAGAIVRSLTEPVIVLVDEDGMLQSVVLELRPGPSPLSFTGRRPASTVGLSFSGVGQGKRVAEPKCLGIE